MSLHLTIIRKKKAERYFATNNWWRALKFWIKNIDITVPKK
jgi:hypothetical protein